MHCTGRPVQGIVHVAHDRYPDILRQRPAIGHANRFDLLQRGSRWDKTIAMYIIEACAERCGTAAAAVVSRTSSESE